MRLAILCILLLPLDPGRIGYSTSNLQNLPRVLKAVAPMAYPPLAAAAMVEGKVKIEVKIDPTGEVISSKIIEEHKLLQDITRYIKYCSHSVEVCTE